MKPQRDYSNNICPHWYTINFCPYGCVTMWHQNVKEMRRNFVKMFKKRDLKNPITKETFVKKMHQFHLMEQYPVGVPKNVITKWE
jgi:predicted membrane protein